MTFLETNTTPLLKSSRYRDQPPANSPPTPPAHLTPAQPRQQHHLPPAPAVQAESGQRRRLRPAHFLRPQVGAPNYGGAIPIGEVNARAMQLYRSRPESGSAHLSPRSISPVSPALARAEARLPAIAFRERAAHADGWAGAFSRLPPRRLFALGDRRFTREGAGIKSRFGGFVGDALERGVGRSRDRQVSSGRSYVGMQLCTLRKMCTGKNECKRAICRSTVK